MSFRLTPLQIPNMTTNYSAENSAFSKLGETLGNLIPDMQKQQQATALRQERQRIGKGLADGSIDLKKAAGSLIALGDGENGINLLKLGEAADQRKAGVLASQRLGAAMGGMLGGNADWMSGGSGGRSLDDLGSPAPASLISSESGGNFRAQNDAVGAGGAVGHFGRAQFGQARLQDAMNAGAIPQGTTPQQFMNSPELQKAAERWHFGDIDQHIQANGYDRLVGQSIAGQPVTIDGLRAVAHLGGKGGLDKFIASGGRHNPADRNGTSLLDYLGRHRGGEIRTAEADMPARGAMPVAGETGQPGFQIPGGGPLVPAISGQQFEQRSAMAPLDPVFQSEGTGQAWMGTALPSAPNGAQVARAPQPQLPPPRPYDLRSDMPALGAAQAMAQQPLEGEIIPPDLSNTPDGGARAFAAMRGRSAEPTGFAIPSASRMDQAPADWARGAPAPSEKPPGTAELGRPTTRDEVVTYASTAKIERIQNNTGKLVEALSDPNLPAAARELGLFALKQRLEASKTPDSIKEFLWARSNGMTQAKTPNEYAKEKTKTSPAEEVTGRKAAAAAAGLREGDAAYQSFILTGKMPREDQSPLSATDRKAILEADEAVMMNRGAIDTLRAAKDLSAKAYQGPLANLRGQAMAAFGSEDGKATVEYDNLITTNALSNLKAIFGGAPTEGERKILLEVQGSSKLPHDARVKVIDRAIAAAERRLAFNEQRANDLRGGTYYKPQGGGGQPAPQQQAPAQPRQSAPQQQAQPSPQAASVPPAAVEFLRANPGARDQFDAKYGRGAAASILGR